MSTKRTTCLGTTESGRQCAAPSDLVGPDGFCPSHGPNGSETMAERGRVGGRVTASRLAGKVGRLDLGLPPLDSTAAATEWLRIVGEAVISGVLSEKRAQQAIAAIREWRAANEALLTETAIREILGPLATGDYQAASEAYRRACDAGIL